MSGINLPADGYFSFPVARSTAGGGDSGGYISLPSGTSLANTVVLALAPIPLYRGATTESPNQAVAATPPTPNLAVGINYGT